jgi:hypothetical protein
MNVALPLLGLGIAAAVVVAIGAWLLSMSRSGEKRKDH